MSPARRASNLEAIRFAIAGDVQAPCGKLRAPTATICERSFMVTRTRGASVHSKAKTVETPGL